MFDRSYFNGHRSNYLLGYDCLASSFFWRRRLREVKELAPAGSRLLDVGCAFGFFLKNLNGLYESYGMDVSGYAIERARTILGQPNRFFCADVEREMPFPGPFDVVTAFDVLEHLGDPTAALAQIARILRPGGSLFLELPTRPPFLDRDTSHCYRFLEDWRELLRQTGFQVRRVRGYWTIGARCVLIPMRRSANYHQIIATRMEKGS